MHFVFGFVLLAELLEFHFVARCFGICYCGQTLALYKLRQGASRVARQVQPWRFGWSLDRIWQPWRVDLWIEALGLIIRGCHWGPGRLICLGLRVRVYIQIAPAVLGLERCVLSHQRIFCRRCRRLGPRWWLRVQRSRYLDAINFFDGVALVVNVLEREFLLLLLHLCYQ